ncbi:MAG TPA: hypothetical protein VL282_09765 [Tepidisphaeraceae bacterium]|jgi:hypothetical protein|nr:hypothetical protein [Tepidisphaeraceae bacterium]
MKRRIIRWILVLDFTFLLLLCAWWTRSAYFSDFLTWGKGTRRLDVRSDWGRLVFASVDSYSPPIKQGFHWEVSEGGYYGESYGPGATQVSVANAFDIRRGKYQYYHQRTTGTYTRVTVYYWVPAALLSLPLLIALAVTWRRLFVLRRRRTLGLCLSCGYDLRGASSERCPECGREIEPSRAAVLSTP